MAGDLSDGDEPVAGINVTPLVDVVLVVLVALMVTATDMAAQNLGVELPRAATGSDATPRTLAIALDATSRTFLDGAVVTEAELRSRVREAREKDPDVRATLAADGRISHSEVVHVMDLLREERVVHFALEVRPGG
jgi:biopolymer transport protein ExbD